MEKTSTGLDENIAALLCYVMGWVSGIIFIIIETENKTVRFHAVQSLIVFGVLCVAGGVLGWIPVIGNFFGFIIGLLAFALWIALMIMAYQGKRVKVPWAGNYAEKWAGV